MCISGPLQCAQWELKELTTFYMDKLEVFPGQFGPEWEKRVDQYHQEYVFEILVEDNLKRLENIALSSKREGLSLDSLILGLSQLIAICRDLNLDNPS